MEKITSNKLEEINAVSFHSLTNENNISILKNFTEKSLDVLGGYFGFVWGNFDGGDKYNLVYKSSNAPTSPILPKSKSEKNLGKKGYLVFDEHVKKENYDNGFLDGVKSYLMIPIRYGNHVYGSIVICYESYKKFTNEELVLAETIYNAVSYAVTINWMIESEKKALVMAEKQKEFEILLEQEKQKTEFLANATHEFRTPLAIIRGTADLALRAKKNKKQEMENALIEINKEVAALSAIIADLVTLIFHGEGEEGPLKLQQINLCKIIDATSSRLKILLRARNMSFRNTCEEKQILISGDKEHLDKLFTNLIRNAITYGKEGGKINIHTEIIGKFVEIKITDTGIGISEEELPHIFERFYRTRAAREMSTIGTGLGLAISKWVVESHGGHIAVESKEGVGTTFTVILPLAK